MPFLNSPTPRHSIAPPDHVRRDPVKLKNWFHWKVACAVAPCPQYDAYAVKKWKLYTEKPPTPIPAFLPGPKFKRKPKTAGAGLALAAAAALIFFIR